MCINTKCKWYHSEVNNNQINTWKYQRLTIWARYCNKEVLLPPPMNILDLIITLPLHLIREENQYHGDKFSGCILPIQKYYLSYY